MNKTIQLFFAPFLLLLSFDVNASSSIESMHELVQKTVTSFMQTNDVPGVAIELYIDGKPAAFYFGYANREKKIPVTKNTIFEIASISKTMECLLLAQEIDAAKMQLNDPVQQYLTDLSDTFDDVTLKNLATHTSGLPLYLPKKIKTRVALDQYFKTWEPTYDADEEWIYSNVGMGMLGIALESATHKKYDVLYREKILSPLKMQPIGLIIPLKYKKYYATGYDKNGKIVAPLQPGLLDTAYGIKASAQDMQRFLSAAIGLPGTPARIFYPMRMTQATYLKLSDGSEQGLGWKIYSIDSDKLPTLLNISDSMNLGPIPVKEMYDKPIFNGNTLIDKTGASDGFRAYIAVIPAKKAGIVMLVNKKVSDPALINTARDILFNLTVKVPPLEKQNI